MHFPVKLVRNNVEAGENKSIVKISIMKKIETWTMADLRKDQDAKGF